MKNLILDYLNVKNFKGQRGFATDFDPIKNNIYAKNEGGKTTLYDGFKWLISDTNSEDKSTFNIKNTKDLTLNTAEHMAEMGINVDGVQNVFRKVLTEKWTRKTGDLEPTKNGNEIAWMHGKAGGAITDIGKGEYMKLINEIIDSEALKTLTGTSSFASMHWTKKRELIFLMAGNPSNAEVAGNNPEFKALLEDLQTKTLDQLKADKAARKLELEKKKKTLPDVIKELTSGLPELQDTEELQNTLEDYNNKLVEIDTAVTNRGAAYNLKNQANTDRNNSIHKIEGSITTIKFKIQQEQQNKDNEKKLANQKLQNEVQSAQMDLTSKSALKLSTEQKIVTLTSEKAAKLADYAALSKTTLPEMKADDCKCPTCQQDLPEGNIEAKKEQMVKDFNADKVKKLKTIMDAGLAKKTEIEAAELLVSNLSGQIKALNDKLLDAQKSKQENEVSIEIIDFEPIFKKDAGIIAKLAEIEQIKAEIEELTPVDYTDLRTQKADIQAKISPITQSIYDQNQRTKTNTRIEELKKEQRDVAQFLVDIEKEEFTIKNFNRAKINLTEDRINSLFDKDVSFQMFRTLENGKDEECCIFKYKGVPYEDVNSAGKIQMSLSVIKTLSKHYGIQAPIFLDNRESTTEIPEMNTQLINLIVSPLDEQLRIEKGEDQIRVPQPPVLPSE